MPDEAQRPTSERAGPCDAPHAAGDGERDGFKKEGKLQFYNNDAIKTACADAKDRLGSHGRVLVRVSGTEPLVRVMVEGEDEDEIGAIARELAQLVEKELA